MHILSIGYGRQLFEKENREYQRLERCAQKVESLHMVIFTLKRENFSVSEKDSRLTLHPTRSKTKLHMFVDAIRIGLKLISETNGSWVVTSQDPFEAGLVGWIIAARRKLPFCVQEHGDFFSVPYWKKSTALNQVRYWIGTYILRHADTVRVVSERTRKTMERIGIARERILSLPVRSDSILTSASSFDLHENYPDASTIILYMGRLTHQKNLPLLLKAFARLHQHDPKVLLLIVGEGSELPVLKKLSQHLAVGEAVVFLPWTDTPHELMRTADIFALPSYWEGWGRVIVEAMAAGTPVVATDVGCAGEILIDNKHGFVVPIGDESAFADRLRQLSEDETLRKKFGAQAQNDVRSTHVSLEEYSEQWAALWKITAERKSDK